MSLQSDSGFSSTFSSTFRTFVICGTVIIGSGVCFVLYQQYVLTHTQQELLSEIRRLTKKVVKLEKDLKKTSALASPRSEEGDEVFVDASEAEPPHTSKGVADDARTDITDFELVDDQMDIGGDTNLLAANETLKRMASANPKTAQVQWRLAKSLFLLASDDLVKNPNSADEQRERMSQAYEAAKEAVRIDSECGDAYKWLAIIKGSITQYLPIQEQIKSAYEIKDLIMLSIKYNPNDSLSHHMLGRWCYSVYSLSWFERRIASTLFASPPTATLEEAMESFLKAEELSPKESIDNCLYLAKGYISQKDYNEAVYWLQEGLKIKSSSRDVSLSYYSDLKALEEIKDLLNQYQSYATN